MNFSRGVIGMEIVLDAIDRRILRELQADATMPIAELAERAGLSQTPCWKRVKRLTDAGVIERRVAILDREQLDLGLVVFVAIRTSRHDEDWLNAFAKGAAACRRWWSSTGCPARPTIC